MSYATPPPTEVLLARKIPWRQRFWVRILLLTTLLFVLLGSLWYWPRRGIIACWFAGVGVRYENFDSFRTLRRNGWMVERNLPNNLSPFYLGYLRHLSETDNQVFSVIINTNVNDRWLSRLKSFPNLRVIYLYDHQLGPGLDDLRNSEQLRDLWIQNLTGDRVKELKRLPQLEAVHILNVTDDDIQLDTLAQLSQLKSLVFGECRHTNRLLKELPELPELTDLS